MAYLGQLPLLYFPYVTLLSLLLPTAMVASTFPTSLPGCPEKCGNVTIPYPFGTIHGCYRNGFDVTCNDSFTPPKPFLGENIDLLEINITSAEARVLNYIGHDCYSNLTGDGDYSTPSLGIRDLKAFLFSHKRNKFTVLGCDSLAFIDGKRGTSNTSYMSGCVSFCESRNATTGNNGSCNGMGCCQTAIPVGLNYYEVNWGFNENKAWTFNPCSYAALMQEDWYHFRVDDLVGYNKFSERNNENVPIVLDWAIRENGTCLASQVESSTSPACKSRNSGCDNTTNGEGYICKCLDGYEGNPYIPNGCIDIDECDFPEKFLCMGSCRNTDGNYTCLCPKGTYGDGKTGSCLKNPEKFPYPARVAIASIGSIAVLVALCFLVAAHRQHKKFMKEKKAYQRYYEMMNNHLRVFSKKQIDIATNSFGETNIIGTGGQGNVYKGLLDNNNQVVAIKKAKKVEETQRGEFVNEIILLSQLNHKNIVRLLGCCLEVEIPMLVYEFVPNGTLYDLLHSKRGQKPISLGTRLKIALESAIALDHLHSAIVRSIIHGDVKSANILLDADYTAKVSDFGASSAVPVNEIVELVHFSHGYLDPECLYTQVITKNSDVYSFGVVMLEIVTRKEAIFVDDSGVKQPLATCFLSKARKNEHLEMLDAEIVSNDKNVMDVLDEICEIVVQCLSPKGEDRPTMMHVAEELQKLVRFHSRSLSKKIDEEEMESLLGETISSMSDASGFHSTQYSAVLEITSGAPR